MGAINGTSVHVVEMLTGKSVGAEEGGGRQEAWYLKDGRGEDDGTDIKNPENEWERGR